MSRGNGGYAAMATTPSGGDISSDKKEKGRVSIPGTPGQDPGAGPPRMTLDEALESLPIGVFHYRLLALCGSSFLADAAEVNLLAFVSVCAGVEWDLTPAQIASITSSVFAGQFFGGLFWGPVADYIGRKKAFQCVVGIISICGFCSAFSPNYATLIVLRMMAGFGIGGLTVPFDLLAEFVPSNRRGEYLMKMEYFWTFGSLSVAAFAWILLSRYGWRSLTMINSTPTLIVSLIGACYLPESPRWLIEAGKHEEAREAVIAAARANGDASFDFILIEEEKGLAGSGTLGGSHALPVYTSDGGTGAEGLSYREDEEDGTVAGTVESAAQYQVKGIWDLVMMHIRLYANLLRKENIGFSYPLWLAWFSFGFAYYGVILFVARIYDNAGTHDNQGGHELTCNFDYASIFINASAELVGIFLVVNFIEITGRTIICFVSFSLAAATCMVMGATIGPTVMLTFSLIARAASVASNSTVWVLTPELYKTSVRATGHSSCNGFTRVGAFLSPFMVQSDLANIKVSSLLFAANVIGMLCSTCLPETLGRSIEDDIPLNQYSEVFLFGGVPRAVLVKMFGWVVCYEGDERYHSRRAF